MDSDPDPQPIRRGVAVLVGIPFKEVEMKGMNQWLIDFCELRMHGAMEAAEKRDRGWLWKLTMRQERFWSDLGWWLLRR